MLGGKLLKALLDKGGGVLRIPPDLHRGTAGKGYLQHDLHELVELFPVGEVSNQVKLNLVLNLSSLFQNFFHSFHRCRWRCRWRGGAGGRE